MKDWWNKLKAGLEGFGYVGVIPFSFLRLRLKEPDITSPIIVSYRPNDSSALLARMLNLIEGFDQRSNLRARQRKA